METTAGGAHDATIMVTEFLETTEIMETMVTMEITEIMATTVTMETMEIMEIIALLGNTEEIMETVFMHNFPNSLKYMNKCWININ